MHATRLTALAAVLAATIVPISAAHPKTQAKRDLSKGNTLYVVPYAHLDTQWRWAYPQVIREYIWNTMSDNLALIDKYPHYVFNFSGSRRYEMMREYYPEEYAKVAAAIKAGRWFPCGSSVDEGDANVPSAESIIRHVLYGNHYFRKNFGVASQEFMLPDCFGFPYALPTILRHCGLDGFSTQKLTWGSAVGIPFKVGNWEGPDGQSIVAALDPGSYGGGVNEDLSQNTSWLARITDTGKKSGAYVDYHYYGTGDRGGSPDPDSVAWMEKSVAGKGPITVVSSRADEMFTSLTPEQKSKLPHYKGELLLTEHSAGSITSQAHMKRWNRKNELLADAAEKASVAAMWLGRPYPQQRLYTAWDLLLGSQMHDMLPGTSLPKAYEFCYNDELLAANQFSAVARDSVGAVASQLDTRAKGTPVVVYNPLSIPREDIVEAWLPATQFSYAQAFGPDGKPVPTQMGGVKGDKVQVLFLGKAPASGMAAYDVRNVAPAQYTPNRLRAEGRTVESPRFRVTINEAGDISSVYDKLNRRETLKAPTSLDFQHHNPSAFPAWNMDWDDAKQAPYAKVGGPAKITVTEKGPVRATIEIERETNGSKFVQRVHLAEGGAGDRVEIENVIDWRTRESALKAAFPLTTANPNATYDLQVGAIERGNNNPRKYEVPQHQWFDLTSTDGKYGVAVLNDSKFGSDKPSDDTVRLTLLYTPGVRAGYQDQAVQDFGRHNILYALAPHVGDWRQGNVAWTAKRLNQPLRAFVVPAHSGGLGKRFSLVSTFSKQVEVQAVKRAEDGDGIVVRLRELTGRPASNARVNFAGRVLSAQELDGQERPLGAAMVADGALVANVRGFGLKTYRVRLAAANVQAPAVVSQPVPLSYDLDAASTDKNDRDGAFDAQGRTYPAEQLPKALNVDDVNFRLGPTNDGAKNAVVARGQTIKLPAGYRRVYVLTAATSDIPAIFKVGDRVQQTVVPAWDGYVGQWDTRLWGGVQPELAFGWDLPFIGVAPGFVKKSEVAWYASHRHIPGKGNGQYQYSYLFTKAFDVPNGATTLTLPNDPRVRIFAVSVAKANTDTVQPAAPLFDTLEDHVPGGEPQIVPTRDLNGNGVDVTLVDPLYSRGADLRYTVDGSEPTIGSPIFRGESLHLVNPTTIKVAQVRADGRLGPVATMQVDAHDDVRPVVTGIRVVPDLGLATVTFSERLDRVSAEDPSHYGFRSQIPVRRATLMRDGRTVELELDPNATIAQDETMGAVYVKDVAGNPTDPVHIAVSSLAPVYAAPDVQTKTSSTEAPVPTAGNAPWTVNLWVKVDKQPEDRTIIGGFGRSRDGRAGTGRYLTKFSNGIQFWAADMDVPTTTQLDLGKWQMLTATYDGGTLRVFKNGKEIGSGEVGLQNDVARVNILPLDAWEHQRKIDGQVRDFAVWNVALSPRAVTLLYGKAK